MFLFDMIHIRILIILMQAHTCRGAQEAMPPNEKFSMIMFLQENQQPGDLH